MHHRAQTLQDHPLITARWQVIRDCLAGQERVKDKRTQYLPPTEGAAGNPTRYQIYHQDATFWGVAAHTLAGLLGLANRIPPRFAYPAGKLASLRDVLTMRGRTREEHAAEVLEEILAIGRVGVLIDWPDGGNALPHEVLYPAESILEWEERSVGGRLILSRVLLSEPTEGGMEDLGVHTITGRTLELRLNDAGNYTAKRHAVGKDEAGKDAVGASEETEVRFRGSPVKRIPLFIAGRRGLGAAVEEPGFADICELALAHYRCDAKLQAASLFCSFGTTYFPYSLVEDVPKEIGPGLLVALALPQGQGGTPVINIRADRGGADLLRDIKRDLERQIATLGGDMVGLGAGPAETAEAVRMKLGQKVSPLLVAVTAAESLLNACEGFRAELLGVKLEEPIVTLSRDFIDTRMTPQELTGLREAWLAGTFGDPYGDIAIGTLYHLLKQGEMLPDGQKLEDFRLAHQRGAENPELIGPDAPEEPTDG